MNKVKEIVRKQMPFFTMAFHYLGKRIFLLYALSLVVGALDAIGISLLVPVLKLADSASAANDKDTIIQGIFQVMKFVGLQPNLVSILLFLILIFSVKGILKFLLVYFRGYLRAIFTSKVRQDLVLSFLDYNYINYLSANIGRISNTLTSEVISISASFNYFNNSIISLFSIIAYLYIAFISNPLFTVGAIVAGGFINLVMRGVTKNTKKLSIELSDSNAAFSGLLIQLIQNFKYLRTTGTVNKFAKKLVGNVQFLQKLQTTIGLKNAMTLSVREPVSIIFVCLIILFQVKYMGNSISSVMIALLLFYRALSEILQFQNNWQLFVSSHGTQESVLGMRRELKDNKEQINYKGTEVTFDKSIIIKDLSFAYPNGSKVLDSINLEISKNKTIAFVGESGSGKSTLIDLLSGIVRPTEGDILVDGVSLHKESNILSWRRKIGFIAQDNVVFSDDIINNITLWDDVENDEVKKKAEYAAEKSHSLKFINNLDEGFKSFIGDRGIKLSGGQKQRLAIARELYKDIKLLILDEATSALDSESESIIKTNIDDMKGQLTIIIIAHRLSTIRNADFIYVLKNGSIAESGTYEGLLSVANSEFYKMVNLQSL